jgi:hypothetical protein|tara:strand:+ start:175 stop:312 length:138 start_codon:yes stop_codon:yes gene_type:complete
MVKKFKAFVNEESVKDFEEDVLGETQPEKQVDKKEKEVEEKNENI